MGKLWGRKQPSLEERLSREPEYRPLILAELTHAAQIAASHRYRVGDLIRVPRTGGHHSLGVVTKLREDQQLVVEVRSQKSGSPSQKELDPKAVARANPLKIGDYIELDGAGFWVAGVDDEGELVVVGHTGERVDPKALCRRIELAIADLDRAETIQVSESEMVWARPSLDRAPTRPMPKLRPSDGDRYVPIESIIEASTQLGLIAGNRETDTVYGLISPLVGAALHTDRGYNYKAWNEDGGALFADKQGRIYVGVFDQAGGEGQDADNHGAASAVAAQAFFERMKASARGQDDDQSVENALVEAAHVAHRAILNRGVGEVTTYIAGRIDRDKAIIVNIGDSAAMLFDREGHAERRTEAQGFGRLLLEGLGIIKEQRLPQHQSYVWPLEPGDSLVFGSDGLFDSKLKDEELGRIIAEASTAADATRALRDIVRERMKEKSGKPDNLTVLVVRVEEKD